MSQVGPTVRHHGGTVRVYRSSLSLRYRARGRVENGPPPFSTLLQSIFLLHLDARDRVQSSPVERETHHETSEKALAGEQPQCSSAR